MTAASTDPASTEAASTEAASTPSLVVGALDDGRPGPLSERAVVLDNRPVGAYRHLVLRAEAGRRAVPGQFAAVAVGAEPGEPTATVLRRAFSLHRAAPAGRHGPTVELVVAPRGVGSRWLAARRPGAVVELLAPLGRPFPHPAAGRPVVLVAGGYGAAPMGWWARQLRRHGHSVAAVFGAGDADRLFGVDDAQEVCDPVLVTTDDGSAGVRGRVSDVLADLVAPGAQVYACGPMPMLRAVTDLAGRAGSRAWCTVEESMACGLGICMTCVLPVRWDDGVTRMTRSCVEGPTFDGAAVRWEAVGAGPGGGCAVPADCLGAPPPSRDHADFADHAKSGDQAKSEPGSRTGGQG